MAIQPDIYHPQYSALEGQESQRSPQATQQWVWELVRMGFSLQVAQVGVYESRATNLEEAIDFLADGRRTWSHPFLRKRYIAGEDAGSSRCLLCGESMDTHIALSLQTSLRPFRSQSSLVRRATSLSLPQILQEHCPICTEAIAVLWKASSCQDHKFCRECAAGYVEEKVKEGHEIHCPFHDCESVLTVAEVRELVGNSVTETWERKQVEQNPLYRHCPALNCTGYLLSVPQSTQIRCPICSCDLCSHCGKSWHPRVPCELVSDQELHSSQAVKACPGCQRFIEKNQGCDHMTCQVCLHEWCWQCLRPYTDTHFLQDSEDYCPVLRLNQQVSLRPTPRMSPGQFCAFLFCWILLSPILMVVFVLLICCLWPCAAVMFAKDQDFGIGGTICLFVYYILFWPLAPFCVSPIFFALIPFMIYQPHWF